MWNRIKQSMPNIFEQESNLDELWDRQPSKHELHPVLEEQEKQVQLTEAQQIVNDALARYCEICRKGFLHPGLAKNHKRLKHKS